MRVAGALVVAQQELEHHRRRELRCAAEPAVRPVELRHERGRRLVELFGRRHVRPGRVEAPSRRQRGHDVLPGSDHLVAPLAPRLGDRGQQLDELRAREERAGEERRAVRREQAGHRPAAVPGQRGRRVHVDGVDVGTFLAVDLDVHVVLVHHRGDLGVLERVVRHHVAPVAGRVADRQQDRDVPLARLGERLVRPLPPVDRIVGVLAQVRAGRVGEPVHPSSVPHPWRCAVRAVDNRADERTSEMTATRPDPAAERDRIRTEHLKPTADRPPSSARGLHHTALISSDVERTVRFYQDVLGFPLTELIENRDYAGSSHFFFDIGNGNLLAFFDFPGLDVGPYAEVLGGLHHMAISVEPQRWEQLVQRLTDAGVEHEVHSGVSVYFRDPDGARIELIADPLGEMYGQHVL